MSTFLFFFRQCCSRGFPSPSPICRRSIQWLTYLNPVAYFLLVVRTIFLKGVGLAYLWPQLLPLSRDRRGHVFPGRTKVSEDVVSCQKRHHPLTGGSEGLWRRGLVNPCQPRPHNGQLGPTRFRQSFVRCWWLPPFRCIILLTWSPCNNRIAREPSTGGANAWNRRRHMISRLVGNVPVVLAVVGTALLAANLAFADDPPVTLVNPNWQPQTDTQGTAWMINPQAMLQVTGGQSMLMQAGLLAVNGNQFSWPRQQMTPDGLEYVFENYSNGGFAGVGVPGINSVRAGADGGPVRCGDGAGSTGGMSVQATRRIKLDLATSTVRFVESYQNTTATPVQVNFSTNRPHANHDPFRAVRTQRRKLDVATGQPGADGGRHQRPDSAAADEYGQRPHGRARTRLHRRAFRGQRQLSRRLVLRAQCGQGQAGDRYPGDAHCPHILQRECARARDRLGGLGMSQRKGAGAFSVQELKDRQKTFEDRKWLAGLPKSVVKTLVNIRGDEPPGSAAVLLMQPVLDLAAQNHVKRGKANVLVQDEQTQVSGVVSGGSLSVETSWGKISLPLAEVALLCGGIGADQPMRVYLRDGQVLSGRIEAKDLAYKAQDGVEAKLPPEKINMLFLHAAADDGKAPPDAHTILQTHDGQRLLIGGDARLHVILPWGGLDADLGEIVSLSSRREPQPLYRMILRDGSSLFVLLQDDATVLKTLRFGPVKLSSLDLRQLWSLKRAPRKRAHVGSNRRDGAEMSINRRQRAGRHDRRAAAAIDYARRDDRASREGDSNCRADRGSERRRPLQRRVGKRPKGHWNAGRPHDSRPLSRQGLGSAGPHLIGITGPRKATPAPVAKAVPATKKRQTGTKPPATKPVSPPTRVQDGDDPFGNDPDQGPARPAPGDRFPVPATIRSARKRTSEINASIHRKRIPHASIAFIPASATSQS